MTTWSLVDKYKPTFFFSLSSSTEAVLVANRMHGGAETTCFGVWFQSPRRNKSFHCRGVD